MRSAVCSMAATLTGRFSHAFLRPATIFSRSNTSRRPSFFTIIGSISSTRSYVVKRRLQCSHSRRRRIIAAVLGEPRVDDLVLEVVAEGALHRQQLKGESVKRKPELRVIAFGFSRSAFRFALLLYRSFASNSTSWCVRPWSLTGTG